jgi:hypothetical protein
VNAQNYPVSEIPEHLKQNANAVIRDYSEECTIKSIDEMTIKRRFVITVLDKAGDEFSYIHIGYDPTTKASNIKVNQYNAAGKLEKTFAKKDFGDFSASNSGLYVDDRVLFLQPMPISYPFTIEYSYETNTSNTIFIDDFFPLDSFNLSVQKAVYKIVNLSGIKINDKITNTDIAEIQKTENGNTNIYTLGNIAAIKKEDLAPDPEYLAPKVEFSVEKFTLEKVQGNLTDWNSFGKWIHKNLLVPVSEITPEIRQEIASLNLQGTTEEKVKTIYQYMQNKTRYVLVSIGIGGWKPMPASEVSKKGYGDCKALTNYMRTLLAAAGIPSYYSIIYSDETEWKFDENFPRMGGNHVILMIPAETGNIWLENTSQKIAFNHISYRTRYRNVLAVNENGIEIIDTPIYKPEESKEEIAARINLNEDASAVSDAEFRFTGGQYDLVLNLLYLKNNELKDIVKERYLRTKVSDFSVENLSNNRDNAEIGFSVKMKTSDFAKKLGNDLFFPAIPFGGTPLLTSREERKLPFETAFPYQDDYKIEYSAPAGFKFSELPNPMNFSSEFGAYQINFEIKDDKLLVHRTLTINKGIYPKEKYKDYAAFLKKAANADNAKILLEKL